MAYQCNEFTSSVIVNQKVDEICVRFISLVQQYESLMVGDHQHEPVAL
jgi:hypothetical protein